MNGLVLDSSALIALLVGEPHSEAVAKRIQEATAVHLSAVTFAEAAGKLRHLNVAVDSLTDLLVAADVAIDAFAVDDVVQALQVQGLDEARLAALPDDAPKRARRRLSLGDRCCLALALRLDVPALTGDRAWADLGEPARVVLFR